MRTALVVALLLAAGLVATSTASADCLSDVDGCMDNAKGAALDAVNRCIPVADCAEWAGEYAATLIRAVGNLYCRYVGC